MSDYGKLVHSSGGSLIFDAHQGNSLVYFVHEDVDPKGTLSLIGSTTDSLEIAYSFIDSGGSVSLFRGSIKLETFSGVSGSGNYLDSDLNDNTTYYYYLRDGESSSSPLLASLSATTDPDESLGWIWLPQSPWGSAGGWKQSNNFDAFAYPTAPPPESNLYPPHPNTPAQAYDHMVGRVAGQSTAATFLYHNRATSTWAFSEGGEDYVGWRRYSGTQMGAGCVSADGWGSSWTHIRSVRILVSANIYSGANKFSRRLRFLVKPGAWPPSDSWAWWTSGAVATMTVDPPSSGTVVRTLQFSPAAVSSTDYFWVIALLENWIPPTDWGNTPDDETGQRGFRYMVDINESLVYVP